MKKYFFTLCLFLSTQSFSIDKAKFILVEPREITYKIDAKKFEIALKSNDIEKFKNFIIEEHTNYAREYFEIFYKKNNLIFRTTELQRFFYERRQVIEKSIHTFADVKAKDSIESAAIIHKSITDYISVYEKNGNPTEIQSSIETSRLILFFKNNESDLESLVGKYKEHPEIFELTAEIAKLKKSDSILALNKKIQLLEVYIYGLAGLVILLLIGFVGIIVDTKKKR